MFDVCMKGKMNRRHFSWPDCVLQNQLKTRKSNYDPGFQRKYLFPALQYDDENIYWEDRQALICAMINKVSVSEFVSLCALLSTQALEGIYKPVQITEPWRNYLTRGGGGGSRRRQQLLLMSPKALNFYIVKKKKKLK